MGLSEAPNAIGWGVGSIRKGLYGDIETPEYQPYQYDPSSFRVGIDNQSRLSDMATRLTSQSAHTLDQSQQGQFRQEQENLVRYLRSRAAGSGPSAAETLMQRGNERNLASLMAASASQRGRGSFGARQQSLQSGLASANQAGIADMAVLRAREQQQAQQTLGSVLGQARGQDIGVAQADLQSEIQQQQMNNSLVAQFMQMGMNADAAQAQARMRLQELMARESQFAHNSAVAQSQVAGQQVGSILSAAGSAAGMAVGG